MANVVAIIDYGMGNVQSISNAFRTLGYSHTVTRDLKDIASADAYVVPGVGAFPHAMENMKEFHLIEILLEQVGKSRKPCLCICLGMQILASNSTELGLTKGLGVIPGRVEEINRSRVTVPHVGWNMVNQSRNHPLFKGVPSGSRFYFDHSFHLKEQREEDVIATTNYGGKMVVAIEHKRFFGVQFHPEKSQTNGLRVLKNFVGFI